MTEDIKNFIRKYAYLIDIDDWDGWFEKVLHAPEVFGMFKDIGQTTKFLMNCGCEPLKYLSHLPTGFLSGTIVNELILPDNIHKLDDQCCKLMKFLQIVDLPESCTSIGEEAFKHCSMLERVTIRSKIMTFGKHCFSNCYMLDNIIFHGTKEEWMKIRPLDLVDITVTCSDGKILIEVDGTITYED